MWAESIISSDNRVNYLMASSVQNGLKTMFFKDYSLLVVFNAYLRCKCTIPGIYTHRRLQEFEVTRARFSGALARRKNFALMISYRVWFHYFSSRDFLRSEKRAHLLGLTSSKISLVTTSLFSLEKCTLYHRYYITLPGLETDHVRPIA